MFYNRNNYYRGGDAHGGVNRDRGGFNGDRGGDRGRANAENRPPNAGGRGAESRPGAAPKPFEGDNRAARGYAEPRGQSGTRSGAFTGYDHGGETRNYSSRGSASMGGGARSGGGSRGGGGGGRPH